MFAPKVEGQTVNTVGTETDLKAAISNAANNVPVVITIDKPIALTGSLAISANKHVTLASSGNTELELFGVANANTITIENRGVLMLDGIIVTHVSGASGVGVSVSSGGKLTMLSGKISGNSGYGINNNGNFTLSGGAISNNGNYGVYTSGTGSNFTMTGGEISSNRYGVYLATYNGFFNMTNGKIFGSTGLGVAIANGIFTMTGGEISNNVRGVENSATFIMSGGKISGNTVSNNGAGVYSTGIFTMSGGEISDNTVTGNYNGGGVYNSGTFTMSGGEISKNTATNGGGVFVYNGIFNLYSGKISSNTASRNGGGVWVTDTVTNFNRLFVRSSVVFSDNRALAAYNRDSAHDSTYNAYIENGVVWTSPFTQGYNNFDISYVYGTSITTFTVTVNDSFAESSGAGGYSVGAVVTLNAGTHTGYNFYRWIVNSGGVSLPSTTNPTATFTMPANNVVVTSSWTIIQYSITYTLNSGVASGNPTSYNVENSFPITIANPTRTNYEFSGWNVTYANGTQISFQTSYRILIGTTGNIALSANWRTPQTTESGNGGGSGSSDKSSSDNNAQSFTVEFVDWDGTVLKFETVSYGGSVVPPDNPTNKGYVFTGWDSSDGSYTYVTKNVRVTALYAQLFTVEFVDWDGTVLKFETVSYGGSVVPPDNPANEGYVFMGWDGSYTNIQSDTRITALYRAKNVFDNPTVIIGLVITLFVIILVCIAYLVRRHQARCEQARMWREREQLNEERRRREERRRQEELNRSNSDHVSEEFDYVQNDDGSFTRVRKRR